jgi:hypothetical protein
MATIEQRLKRVERELERVRAILQPSENRRWWRQIMGDFKDDKAFAEIVRLGKRIRRSQRER